MSHDAGLNRLSAIRKGHSTNKVDVSRWMYQQRVPAKHSFVSINEKPISVYIVCYKFFFLFF